ncbi:hypothetical protein M5E82_18725 [Parabacteroides distasonis]|nr:hypothetical protein M5E82_18725 [Parabacteroides distasonis]
MPLLALRSLRRRPGGDLPNDDPNSCVVTITLWTSCSARPPQTKAGEMMTKADFWEEEEDQYERDITDWLVVAYDDENVELAGYTSSNGTWTPGINNPDSRTEVEMKLPLGKYSFMRSPICSRWKMVHRCIKNYRGTFLGGTVGGEDIGLGNEYRYKE